MFIEHFLLASAFIFIQISGSALHGNCETNEDCGTIDTHCNQGICACKPNFAVWFDSCVHLATPRLSCRRKGECHSILGGRSICTKSGECACREFHHLHNGQCVKNRDLHDICEHDHQCYCGADCTDKIACIGRNCTCKAGHRAYRSRRCISEIATELEAEIGVKLVNFQGSSGIKKSVSKILFLGLASIIAWNIIFY